ncbi:hypothetical protein [Aliikangiella coralliicola]|uniref:Uncharacterized protein n=1 Tax=Aliikangiella coralliicola TaxID=2592383 RepID=A0A545U095_9GAMM|nr:hypothetical protein [Aliikangiella coralliicola]TQV82887.1 hypothetical protein FLL46_24260 [Aliikangiella coralliicola]
MRNFFITLGSVILGFVLGTLSAYVCIYVIFILVSLLVDSSVIFVAVFWIFVPGVIAVGIGGVVGSIVLTKYANKRLHRAKNCKG